MPVLRDRRLGDHGDRRHPQHEPVGRQRRWRPRRPDHREPRRVTRHHWTRRPQRAASPRRSGHRDHHRRLRDGEKRRRGVQERAATRHDHRPHHTKGRQQGGGRRYGPGPGTRNGLQTLADDGAIRYPTHEPASTTAYIHGSVKEAGNPSVEETDGHLTTTDRSNQAAA